MIHSADCQNEPGRRRSAPRTQTVCVVDSNPDDYRSWQTAAAHQVRLEFFTSAAEALRFSRSQNIDLWVVNTNLPGLSGFELCEMLKGRSAKTVVYMIADEHSADVERQAWRAGASLFGCKPGHESWLHEWRERQMSVSQSTQSQSTPIQSTHRY